MTKKNIIYLLIVVLLGCITFYLLKRNNTGTMGNLKAFSISDTSAITQITIINKANASVILDKQPDGWWMVNNKFRARKDLIGLVLDALMRMEIKSPVPNAAVENVMRDMSGSSTKVQVLGKDGVIKTFYVGGTTQDELGTYMLLEGTKRPQVVHIPGFNGYLSVRFFVRDADWRDQTIFDYKSQNIDCITVNYTNNPAASFMIKVVSEEIAQITNLAGDTAKAEIDGDFFRKYLRGYRNVQYDFLAEKQQLTTTQRDSILATVPYCTISVTGKDESQAAVSLYLFPKAIREGYGFAAYDKQGNPIISEGERFYCLLPNKKEVAVVQNYVFAKLLVSYQQFFARSKATAAQN